MKKLAVSFIAIFAVSAASFGAANINWFSNPAALDETGANLAANSIVQLIKAGAAGPGAPDTSTPDFVGGDDMLVDVIRVGEGLAGGADGVFFQPAKLYDAVNSTDTLFVRAYNLQTLEGAAESGFYYGNSPQKTDWTDPAGSPPPPPDSWSVEVETTVFVPGGVVIPEPSTVMLALAGLAMIAIRKIRK